MNYLFEKISKEKLIDFIVDYAARDDKFANAVNVRFGRPDFDKELSKIKNKIDSMLDGELGSRYRGSWGYISIDTSDIVEEIIQRAEQGHISLAFAETEMLYRKLLTAFEYQEECEISDEAESCIEIMSQIADKAASDEDKKYIFESCIALSELEDAKDYGADYEDKLLTISAKFVTSENLAELEGAIERLEKSWNEEEYKLIRLKIIQNLEDENAVIEFISKNLQYPKIREIAFHKAVDTNNYEEAERLCIGALSEYEQRYGVSNWLYKLYSVYEMMRNTEKLAETAEKILLCGNLEYYDKLKTALTEQGDWESSYSQILAKCTSKLPYSVYMKILAKENEYKMLLESVKKHTEMIYQYGHVLAGTYPADIRDLFAEQINRDAEAAYGRESYNKVCSRILLYIEAGYKDESLSMIDSFKLKYKRKPAFVDELNKIKI